MAEKQSQPSFKYILIIFSGVIGSIVTFLNNLQTIYSALGLAVSLILIGVGVLGWFVTQNKMSFGDGVQYSIIWTLLILLAGTGYYLIIGRPVTVSGSLFDNNVNQKPISVYDITLYHHQTGITSHVRTDTQGNFVFSDVQDGEYDIIINGIVVRSEEAVTGLRKLVQGDIRAGRFYLDSLGIPQQSTSLVITVTPLATFLPSATPDLLASALERAHTFGGRNRDWESFVWEFDNTPMVLVPTGCFTMGSLSGQQNETPVNKICFDKPFWIDQYEVTNQQFAQFGGKAKYQSSNSTSNFPIDTISWVEARDYCQLRGARLPTEAEWEYAARGPDNLVYPWGNKFDYLNVNSCDKECNKSWKSLDFDDGYGFTAPVGNYPLGISWVGAYDMSGNVWEWVNTIYGDYPYNATDGRESPDNMTRNRVFRGGSWATIGAGNSSFIFDVRTSFRDKDSPQFANSELGLRCARGL